MIQEKTFLRRFKKNWVELLKTEAERMKARERLTHGGCPFPQVCYEHLNEGKCRSSCPSTAKPSQCPVSPEWQRQIAYFWPRKSGLLPDGSSNLIQKMIKTVEGI